MLNDRALDQWWNGNLRVSKLTFHYKCQPFFPRNVLVFRANTYFMPSVIFISCICQNLLRDWLFYHRSSTVGPFRSNFPKIFLASDWWRASSANLRKRAASDWLLKSSRNRKKLISLTSWDSSDPI